jgi:signal transduction histidine kinase
VHAGTLTDDTALVAALLAGGVAALVVRYRAGSGELRQQIKWVALAVVGLFVFESVAALGLAACQCDRSPVAVAAYAVVSLFVLFGLPGAIALAILKHGLYEIDVIINRAVVYGLLAVALTSVYVGIVAGVGALAGRQGGPVLTIVAAALIALRFQPLRQRAQRVANRLVFGERATPYQVLSDLARDMAGTLGLDDVLERMVSALADGTGAIRVDVWIRVGAELRPVAAWPRQAPAPEARPLGTDDELPLFPEASRAVAVRHAEELLGALTLEKPRGETLSMTEDKLLHDLASQAGLVLRNVRLTAELQASIEELRASRRRLVEAQDAERRKLERNLHDGAQQQLVALRVNLGLLERVAEDSERVRQMARQIGDALQSALDDLRDLARGIFPPLLADKGLAVALEAQGRKAAVATAVESDGMARYPQDVEAAVYFCALEAMQNVAKHAEASSATVRIAEREGYLVFEVEDDGRGFDRGRTGYGTGLQGMADRIEAIGGSLEVSSPPRRGTLVRGRIRLR